MTLAEPEESKRGGGTAGRTVFVGCCGALAVITTPTYIMHMRDALGVNVIVGMTRVAERFISPQTMELFCEQVVRTDGESHGSWVSAGEISKRVDGAIIVPASANTIAEIAHGGCGSIVSGVALHLVPPTIIVPSVPAPLDNRAPYLRNLQQLRDDGHIVAPSRVGPVLRLSDDHVTREQGMLPPAAITRLLRDLLLQKIPR